MSYERPPAVAGAFYPGEPARLRRAVEALLAPPRDEEARAEEKPVALIAPHAGYVYSGAIAAAAYRRASVPSRTIVLCPNHTGFGPRASLFGGEAYLLPGDRVPVDAPLAAALERAAGLHRDLEAHRREHAIEVHLPFLRARNPEARIVPIVLGGLSYEDCERIGRAFAGVIAGEQERPLLLASTDMSHFLSAEATIALDRLALDRVEALDPRGLYEVVRARGISMCGFIPTTITLIASLALGAREAELVRYGHSGEVSGDRDRVVGYAAFLVR